MPRHEPGRKNAAARNRVKHSMRKSPYLVSLAMLLVATTFTLLNISVPDLIRVVNQLVPTCFETQYGLYQRCTRPRTGPLLFRAEPITDGGERTSYYDLQPDAWAKGPWQCERFPTRSECAEFGESFCVQWSTAGYTAQLALVPCLFALMSLLFIFLHRGQRTARARARRKQWKLVSVAMFIHCALQLASIILILRVYMTDSRFHGHDTKSRLDRSFWFGVIAAFCSGITFGFLTFTGLAARRGEPWAAGRSARRARRHKRTLSGRVVSVPEGTPIPPEQVVTVGEVVAAHQPDEHSPLLAGHEDGTAAGGGQVRATGSAV